MGLNLGGMQFDTIRHQVAEHMMLWIIRGIFLLVWAGIGAYLVAEFGLPPFHATLTFGGIMMLSALVIGLDILSQRKNIAVVSAVFVGLLLGLLLSRFAIFAIVPFIEFLTHRPMPAVVDAGVRFVVPTMLCYVCVSILLQTKDDFRFIIPYVEFSREMKGTRPLVLDTSVIIDGRIADLADTRLFDNPLIVPGFVLHELQLVADSSDKLKRNRGRRGLDVLNRLRTIPNIDLQTNELELPEFQAVRDVDQRLVLLAKHLNAKIVTNDFNLNKLAKLQGVDVVNLNDLANALKPVVLPGETMSVLLTKPGDQPGQGVGYLDDGTMVVAEQGKGFIGQVVNLVVTSVLQTSAGRMIFGRLDSQAPGRS